MKYLSFALWMVLLAILVTVTPQYALLWVFMWVVVSGIKGLIRLHDKYLL